MLLTLLLTDRRVVPDDASLSEVVASRVVIGGVVYPPKHVPWAVSFLTFFLFLCRFPAEGALMIHHEQPLQLLLLGFGTIEHTQPGFIVQQIDHDNITTNVSK